MGCKLLDGFCFCLYLSESSEVVAMKSPLKHWRGNMFLHILNIFYIYNLVCSQTGGFLQHANNFLLIHDMCASCLLKVGYVF